MANLSGFPDPKNGSCYPGGGEKSHPGQVGWPPRHRNLPAKSTGVMEVKFDQEKTTPRFSGEIRTTHQLVGG